MYIWSEVENEYTGCCLKKEISLAASEISLRVSLTFRILPLREMKGKTHTRMHTYAQAQL